jgi:hypothetical protein
MSGYLQTWFFVASFIPWFLIDRIGRRPLVSNLIKQKPHIWGALPWIHDCVSEA